MTTSDNIIQLAAAARRLMRAELLSRLGHFEPDSITYAGENVVLVALRGEEGDIVQFVTSAEGLLRTSRLATDCINANLSRILGDAGVL